LCHSILQLWQHIFHSCTSRACSCYTPISTKKAHISLNPTEESVGLLLTCSEFDEVVLLHRDRPNIDPHLTTLIFKYTAGHVGAVVDILSIISNQVCFYTGNHLAAANLSLVLRKRQKLEGVSNCQWQNFTGIFPFINSWRSLMVEILNVVLLVVMTSTIDQHWLYFLETYSGMVLWLKDLLKPWKLVSAISIGGFIPFPIQGMT
jgi:hypothetical protein